MFNYIDAGCCRHGPGYASPIDAFYNGSREVLAYIPCITVTENSFNYLATVDIDPSSPTYCQVCDYDMY